MMKIAFLFLPVVMLFACNGLKSIKTALTPSSPYEKYVEALKKAELLNAAMTRDWLAAGEEVFDDSIVVQVPFSESGFFQASTPQARSYRFTVRDGQVLTIDAKTKTHHRARVFLDLFIRDDSEWKRIGYADSTLSIVHEFDSDEDCLLRLQPELLANTYYAINISLTPVLINPVYGATNKSIGSFYGAPRDNGRRSHEGVDIFAPRGTPVVAPTDGFISRVGRNTLGGKVVWMKDPRRGHSYYFAHLDSQMVKPGMHVRQGHVLGLVGNTGNARRTPPHLHFGIYQSGSRDPLYYIHNIENAIESLPIDTGFQQKPLKVRVAKAAMMTTPSGKAAAKRFLQKGTYVTVIAQSSAWYRLLLPDESEGYVLKKQLVDLAGGTSARLDTTRTLLSEARPSAIPVTTLAANVPIKILANFDQYRFVQTEDGTNGWLAGI